MLAKAPREARPQVRRIVDQIINDERHIQEIDRNRTVVAFDYWRTRVQAERTNEARQARNDVYNADKLKETGEKFEEAKKLYERAWDTWAVLFKQYPELKDNAEARDLIDSIANYRDLLGQLDQPFPADFKLNDLLDAHYDGQQLREQIRLIQGGGPASSTPGQTPKPEETKPDEPKAEGDKPQPPKTQPPKTEDGKPAEEKPAEPPAKEAETKEPEQSGE
jgi:hypothetical protein